MPKPIMVRIPKGRQGRLGAAASVAVALLALSGCGDDASTAEDPVDPSTSQGPTATESSAAATDPAADLPDCAEVWQAGNAVPKRYQGCVADGEVVKADRQRCSSGQILVTFADDYYGVEGGPVNVEPDGLADSETYQAARRACLG